MQNMIDCIGHYNQGWLVQLDVASATSCRQVDMVYNQNGNELKGIIGTVKVRSGQKEGHTGENGSGSPTRKALQIFQIFQSPKRI